MKIVKTQYTVKEEFVVANKSNIKSLTDFIRSLGRHDYKYTVYLLKDGKTFVHLAQYETTTAQEEFLKLPAFIYFQRERDENLETPPVTEEMTLVSSTFDLFTVRDEYIEF